MVRLMLVLAPVMCILGGIALSSTLIIFMKNLDSSTHARHDKKEREKNYPYKNEVTYLEMNSAVEPFKFQLLKVCV